MRIRSLAVLSFLSLAQLASSSRAQTNDETIGWVNKTPITQSILENSLTPVQEEYAQTHATPPSKAEQDSMMDEAFERSISRTLILDNIAAKGMRINDHDLVDSILHNPAPELQQPFMDSAGNFNEQAYFIAMSDPANDSLMRNVLKPSYRVMLLIRHWQWTFQDSVHPKPAEIEAAFLKAHPEAKKWDKKLYKDSLKNFGTGYKDALAEEAMEAWLTKERAVAKIVDLRKKG